MVAPAIYAASSERSLYNTPYESSLSSPPPPSEKDKRRAAICAIAAVCIWIGGAVALLTEAGLLHKQEGNTARVAWMTAGGIILIILPFTLCLNKTR